MTSALLLAGNGQRVCLVESFPLLAPTVRGFSRQGVQFDTGLHYLGALGDGHPLDIYLRHLGIADQLIKVPYNSAGFDRFIDERNGKVFDIPCGFDAFTKKLTQDFPMEAEVVKQYVAAVRKVLESSSFLNFKKPFDLTNEINAGMGTLKQFLDNQTSDTTLKGILGYPSLLYGTPPGKASFATHAQVAGSYILSTYALKGGGNALVKAYEKRLDEVAVAIMCNRQVHSIEVGSDRTVHGVVLNDGQRFETNSCVWTAHPAGLISATPDHAFRPAFKKRLATLKDTTSALMLFGISNIPIPELEGCNIILWPGTSIDANLRGELSIDQSVIFLSSALDPISGKTAITAIAPQKYSDYAPWHKSRLGNRPKTYIAHKQSMLDQFEKELLRRVPSLSDHVQFVDGATPLTLRDYCATPTGSMYGLLHSVEQFNPAPITKVKGLTLAGQGIVAPGALGAIVSAYLTCGIILGHDTLHNQLRQIA